MSYIIAGTLDARPSYIRLDLGSFRHRVFVQRLQWEIPDVSQDSTREWDEFDGGGTVHLVAISKDDTVCGCAHLMPTMGPCLLRDVFAQLGVSSPLPASPSIWELSRFAGSGLIDHRTGAASGMPLLPYALALALSLGATQVVGVVSRAVARLYRRFGLDLQNIGNCVSADDGHVVACAIQLTPATFEKLHCDAGTLLSSITRIGALPSSEQAGPANLATLDREKAS
ncbi:acyl-homoserine-lactone synthase [Paraburkholderia sacchari]|uniref:acyl-homoserine-lactone synthase n=1 Tax=Paraburkholderia sacchari TaxID=159450 RepID=UPI001BCFF44D|nr:acyl-homoserine-lactone synthase [Paraburkholderia sacchari]